MSDSGNRDRRPNGDGKRPDRSSGRPQGGPAKGRPASGRPQRPNAQRPGIERSDRGAARGDRPDDEQRLWTRGGEPARGDRDARGREPEVDRDPFNTRSVRPRHDDPEIPEGVTSKQLDRLARNELKTLSADNQEGVAQHLVMAAQLIETDPELAHRHATSAARRAGRIGVVRETLAITAYAVGDFALALRELRTYRRITGRDDELPMMVDCERGLGRAEKALELGRSVPRASLPVPVQVELAIAMSGARLDLGQNDAALAELQIPQLDPATAYSYSAALFAAYATVLEELGRQDDADDWWRRADLAAEAYSEADSDDDHETIEVVEEELGEPHVDSPHVDSPHVDSEDEPGDDGE